eukprot:435743_1
MKTEQMVKILNITLICILQMHHIFINNKSMNNEHLFFEPNTPYICTFNNVKSSRISYLEQVNYHSNVLISFNTNSIVNEFEKIKIVQNTSIDIVTKHVTTSILAEAGLDRFKTKRDLFTKSRFD